MFEKDSDMQGHALRLDSVESNTGGVSIDGINMQRHFGSGTFDATNVNA